jgi:hypothetical protein
MQTSYAHRPYAERGIAFFQQPPRAVEMSGGNGSNLGALGDFNPLEIFSPIITAISQTATGIANAAARGAEAGEQTKQQVAASQAAIEQARAAARMADAQAKAAQAQAAQAQAAMQAAMAAMQSQGQPAASGGGLSTSFKDIAPWVGAAVLGLGLLFVLGRR